MKQQELVSSTKKTEPCAPFGVVEWICNSCGAGIMTPLYKGCRGLEAREWMVVHFSDWGAIGKWETRRYCPKCKQAMKDALSELDSSP